MHDLVEVMGGWAMPFALSMGEERTLASRARSRFFAALRMTTRKAKTKATATTKAKTRTTAKTRTAATAKQEQG